MKNPFEETQQKNEKPTFLVVLCVLTFIGSGFSLLSNLITALQFDFMLETLNSGMFSGMISQELIDASTNIMLANGVLYYFLAAILNVASICGAFFMLRLNFYGFHIYTFAQVFMHVLPFIFGTGTIGAMIQGLLFSGIFIVLYATQIKFMKQAKND